MIFQIIVLLGKVWQYVFPIAQMHFVLNLCAVCTPFTAMEQLEVGLVEKEKEKETCGA